MDIIDYPELQEQGYKWVIERVSALLKPRSAGIHLTELIYCLTASYWNRIMPLPTTKEKALVMALGIGLEKLLLPDAVKANVGTCEGIDYSPDFVFSGEVPSELKTTRMSTNKTITRNFPETWIQQIMGYCYALKKLEYGLSIVHIMGNYKPPFPEIKAVKFIFTQKELDDNWKFLMWRKDCYVQAVADHVAPTPTRWAKDWECDNCPYATSLIHCNLKK